MARIRVVDLEEGETCMQELCDAENRMRFGR